MARKAMLGHKVRRLRRDLGLTQALMAERLGISASYLNLIENNQRAVTVDLLLRVGQTFDVDLQSFAEDDSARLVQGLREVFSDTLFDGQEVKRQDIVDLVNAAPVAANGVIGLYRAFRQTRDDMRRLAERGAESGAPPSVEAGGSQQEEVVDHFHQNGHHFPELEAAAEEIWHVGGLEGGDLSRGLADYLERELSLRVRIMPSDVMGPIQRRYDRHGRRVLISEMLPLPTRNFQMAVQIGLIKYRTLLDEMAVAARLSSPEATGLGKLVLANYLAGAVMMPYDRFYRAASALRYDLEILKQRFEASYEQVCLRLTTLQRQGAKGVPFFFMRVDKAGNIAKRFSASGLAFARYGGACPRWNVHDAFRWPGLVHTQISELPDGSRVFSIARTINKTGVGYRVPGQTHAVVLGCEISHAAQLVYADGVDLANDDIVVPIGLHCRVCERLDCPQRALPSVHHKLAIDETVRGPIGYVLAPAEG